MNTSVYINAIETAHPKNECHQFIPQHLKTFFPDEPELQARLERVIAKLGIEKRYTVLENIFDFEEPERGFYAMENNPSTSLRMQTYAKKALPLASQALEPLLQNESLESITHLILTSCTGFYAPGLDIDIIQKFGLNPNTNRTLIGFMGCYAAIPAMRQAFDIVRSQPNARVLMLNIELCSLHFRPNAPIDQQLSFLLFADGAAASIISAKPKGIKLDSFYSTLVPYTLDLMRWTIADDGFYMNLDEKIPAVLKSCLQENSQTILSGLPITQMASWAIHPGGRAILDAVQNELDLSEGALQHSRATLRDNGNMSSATIMFVLQKILNNKSALGKGCGMAFGPGLTLESFLYSIE